MKKIPKTPLILGAICLLSFLIKTIPFIISGTEWSNLPDSLYTFRLIELFDTFGYQPPVDYYTTFPEGSPITWGSVFTIICWVFWKLSLLPFVPPILFCGVIIAVYFIGKELVNQRVGLFSALIIAVINGRLFYSSLFGGIDHHIGEVLFSTLFMLFFILALKRKHPLYIVLSAICGALMVHVMPQVMIFPIIICVASTIAYFIRHIEHKNLFVTTGLIFTGMFVLLLPVTNFNYTITDLASGAPIITIGCALAALGHFTLYTLKHYHVSNAGVLALCALLGELLILIPNSSAYLSQFLPNTLTIITETQPYSPFMFITTFTLITLFIIFGVINYKKLNNSLAFMASWVIILSIMTIAHARWEYFLTVPLCIIAALGIEYFLIQKKTKTFNIFIAITIVISACFGIYLSYISADNSTEDTWINIGNWLQENTPKQDYYNNTPPEYGVLTFWEYGHYVEVWGHRATYSNPFQAHIESERMLYTGENIPDNLKYIVIPSEMFKENKFKTDAYFLGLGIDYPQENTFFYKLYNSGKELFEYNGVKIFNNPNLLSA